MALFSSLFNLEGGKKEVALHCLRLSSTQEVKPLGAQNYYVPRVINLKECIFHSEKSESLSYSAE